MARKRMVTRGIKSTTVDLMVVNINNAEVENVRVELATTFKDEAKIIPFIEKNNILEDGYKAVQVLQTEEVEQLYGMLEQDFLRMAHKLDDNRKIIEEVEEA